MTAPLSGPASPEQVAVFLSLPATDAGLLGAVAAADSLVRTWLTPAPDGEWPAHQAYGASLLAARLFRRKDSPAGYQMQGMEAAVYVSRNDPDIAQLLGLGAFAPPRVG